MSRISMKHFFSNIKHHSSASIGIGSLIVFIAMVLVAGIAASVLIQTSNHLESQAMYAGRETKNEVSSDIDILDITGNYNTRIINDEPLSRYHNMTITVTPKSASTINLDEVVIEISNGTKLCLLSWNSSKFALGPSGSGVFSTPGLFDLEASYFGIIVEEDGDGSCTATSPSINRGDKACITVNLSACFNGLESRADIRGMIIPELGSPAVIFFRTPATNTNMVVDFF